MNKVLLINMKVDFYVHENKCLADFYKSLENKTDKNYVNSIKELIEENNLTADTLTKLIDDEVEK